VRISCRSAAVKAGQGGAIAIIGGNQPGVSIDSSVFKENFAVATRSGVVPSIGGALSLSLMSNLTATDTHFVNNLAIFGIGNDVASISGAQNDLPGPSVGNHLKFQDTHFDSLDYANTKQYILKLLNQSETLCSLSKTLKEKIDSLLNAQLALEDAVVSDEGVLVQSSSGNARSIFRRRGPELGEGVALTPAEKMKLSWHKRKFIAWKHNQFHHSKQQISASETSYAQRYRNVQVGEKRSLQAINEQFAAIAELKQGDPGMFGWAKLNPNKSAVSTAKSHFSHNLPAQKNKPEHRLDPLEELIQKYENELKSELLDLGNVYVPEEDMNSGGWRNISHEEEFATDPTDSRDAIFPAAPIEGTSSQQYHRFLRDKLKFLKTSYLNSPSIVISSGICEFDRPSFAGYYHIFVGDFVFLKNLYSSSTEPVDSVDIATLRTSQFPTVAVIKSVVAQVRQFTMPLPDVE
jgi:hypothetical protein